MAEANRVWGRLVEPAIKHAIPCRALIQIKNRMWQPSEAPHRHIQRVTLVRRQPLRAWAMRPSRVGRSTLPGIT